MKESLYHLNKKLKLFLSLRRIKNSRKGAKNSLSLEESFNVPIIINNFNRCTFLLQLITWLENNGYTNIIVLDNDSTYPKLLEYYAVTKHKIIFLKKNLGYKALWQSSFFDDFKTGFYVYTDPDVVPNKNCPSDVVFQLFNILNKYSEIEKCGTALEIDNLPDSYSSKKQVKEWEKKHWENSVEENVYNAPVDTTFALYRPFAMGEAEICKAYRLAGAYTFLHLPWYVNSADISQEDLFYKNSINKTQSHWVK